VERESDPVLVVVLTLLAVLAGAASVAGAIFDLGVFSGRVAGGSDMSLSDHHEVGAFYLVASGLLALVALGFGRAAFRRR
jgi:hypothetical protein